MTEILTELGNIFKTMPAYLTGLFEDHTILAVLTAIVFIYVLLFSNKIANKLRTIFVLAALLLIVFSFISQSWPRITLITLGLVVLFACRLLGYAISEIRIIRRNKRIEERALEKAAKRRGSWENKQGYSGARKLIVEPEYIPEEMNQEEIDDIINNEISEERHSEENTDSGENADSEEIADSKENNSEENASEENADPVSDKKEDDAEDPALFGDDLNRLFEDILGETKD